MLQVEESLQDFDAALKISPEMRPYLWQVCIISKHGNLFLETCILHSHKAVIHTLGMYSHSNVIDCSVACRCTTYHLMRREPNSLEMM
jgi:hypothetical protein